MRTVCFVQLKKTCLSLEFLVTREYIITISVIIKLTIFLILREESVNVRRRICFLSHVFSTNRTCGEFNFNILGSFRFT